MEGRSMQTTSKSEEAGWWTCYQRSSRMNILQLLLYLMELLEMLSSHSLMCSTSKFCMLNAFFQVVSIVRIITKHFILQHASQMKTTAHVSSNWGSHNPLLIIQSPAALTEHCTEVWAVAVSCCKNMLDLHTRQVFKEWCQSMLLFMTHHKWAIIWHSTADKAKSVWAGQLKQSGFMFYCGQGHNWRHSAF